MHIPCSEKQWPKCHNGIRTRGTPAHDCSMPSLDQPTTVIFIFRGRFEIPQAEEKHSTRSGNEPRKGLSFYYISTLVSNISLDVLLITCFGIQIISQIAFIVSLHCSLVI